jgi:hypothetical protein
MTSSPAVSCSILGERIVEGQQIIMSAAMIGDTDDFGVWSQRCRRWTRATGESLTAVYGEESASTFQRATAAAGATQPWHETLATEVERVQQVVGMLGTLSQELMTAVGEQG